MFIFFCNKCVDVNEFFLFTIDKFEIYRNEEIEGL